jgi:SpoIID/LytB domain protein
VVRIGVVLAEDAMPAIDMRVPDAAYELAAAGAAPHEVRAARISARLEGKAVSLAVNGGPAQTAAGWTLTPQPPRLPARGDGVWVKGVVAGRGFHWQKHVDQTLAGRIDLLPGDRGIILVNELPLEAYLACVITSEMSSQCPVEFLRAQCITARSWLLAFTEPKHDAEPFDRCNDDCCQRYQGTGDLSDTALDAVESTRGLVLVAADGRVVDANYSKSCGGVVELPEHVWGVHKPGLGPQVDAPAHSAAHRFLPVTEANLNEYLEGDWLRETDVYCSPRVVPEESLGRYLGRVDETGRYFRWSVRYTHDELADMLRRKLPEAARIARLSNLRVTRRGISGRATEIVLDVEDAGGRVRQLTIADQYRIRQILHKSFLFSSAFAVHIERDSRGLCRAVTLRGAGWGHGAGLCQIGALGMALCGNDHARIVKHYFPEAELKRLYA